MKYDRLYVKLYIFCGFLYWNVKWYQFYIIFSFLSQVAFLILFSLLNKKIYYPQLYFFSTREEFIPRLVFVYKVVYGK